MSRFKTRDIILQNHTQVYEHFDEAEIWPRTTRLGRYIVSQIYKPDVHMKESTWGHINNKIENGSPLIFAPNHVRYIDHLVGFSALDSVFDIGDTNILGKVPYFQSSIMRALSEPFGTLPVFREKDLPENPTPEQLQQLGIAGIEMIDVVINKMKQRNNTFGYPEGARNDKDRFDLNGEDKWLRVMKLKQGIAKIAFNAWTKHNLEVSMIPIGTYYEPDDRYSWRHPIVYIGDPVTRSHDPRNNSISAITVRLQVAIQQSVDDAHEFALKNAA